LPADVSDASLSRLIGTFDPVPRISAFYGIVIAIFFDDHPPPHFGSPGIGVGDFRLPQP